jgi:hypothetical protein
MDSQHMIRTVGWLKGLVSVACVCHFLVYYCWSFFEKIIVYFQLSLSLYVKQKLKKQRKSLLLLILFIWWANLRRKVKLVYADAQEKKIIFKLLLPRHL